MGMGNIFVQEEEDSPGRRGRALTFDHQEVLFKALDQKEKACSGDLKNSNKQTKFEINPLLMANATSSNSKTNTETTQPSYTDKFGLNKSKSTDPAPPLNKTYYSSPVLEPITKPIRFNASPL
jgi:hypothetical protein